MLRVAASIAGGVPVDLREAALCLDADNAARAARAVCHAAGCGVRGAGCGVPGAGRGGARPTTAGLLGTVVITRPRHLLHGLRLRVLGGMRRHGARELLVELPDGSKRLVLASRTDLDPAAGEQAGDGPGTLGSAADLLGLSVLVSALCARSREDGAQAARNPPARGKRGSTPSVVKPCAGQLQCQAGLQANGLHTRALPHPDTISQRTRGRRTRRGMCVHS